MTQHTLHIGVMGTCFTLDTPIKVAKYGFSSVISLVADDIIEVMYEHYAGKEYEAISRRENNSRARRITRYLNLADRLVNQQVEEIKYQQGEDFNRYFDMLPCDIPCVGDNVEPGSIDVNIMVKLNGGQEALEGFCNSNLNSNIVFSAGFKADLYKDAAERECFHPGGGKGIILKVSDFRSASKQGGMLAKLGLWVNEYRIESGLNCGGHAFATKGKLLGPVLEEFKEQREKLNEKLSRIYRDALKKKGITAPDILHTRITAQGGITTGEENSFLMNYFKLDGTGFSTPLLFVPEATGVDEKTLKLLIEATEDDIYLSDSSPLGVPFWNLRTSLSEERRRELIAQGKPGTPCKNGFLALEKQMGENICTASRGYQRARIVELNPESADYLEAIEKITDKSCICFQLGDSILKKYGIGEEKEKYPAVCPGPNAAVFKREYTLDEMMKHFYGGEQVVDDPEHMFIRELGLYIDNLGKVDPKDKELHVTNLFSGIAYYKKLANKLPSDQREQFNEDLDVYEEKLKKAA